MHGHYTQRHTGSTAICTRQACQNSNTDDCGGSYEALALAENLLTVNGCWGKRAIFSVLKIKTPSLHQTAHSYISQPLRKKTGVQCALLQFYYNQKSKPHKLVVRHEQTKLVVSFLLLATLSYPQQMLCKLLKDVSKTKYPRWTLQTAIQNYQARHTHLRNSGTIFVRITNCSLFGLSLRYLPTYHSQCDKVRLANLLTLKNGLGLED